MVRQRQTRWLLLLLSLLHKHEYAPARVRSLCPVIVTASANPGPCCRCTLPLLVLLQPSAAAVLANNAGLPVVCLENSGGIRTDIPAGNVTLAQVNSVLPFGNT